MCPVHRDVNSISHKMHEFSLFLLCAHVVQVKRFRLINMDWGVCTPHRMHIIDRVNKDLVDANAIWTQHPKKKCVHFFPCEPWADPESPLSGMRRTIIAWVTTQVLSIHDAYIRVTECVLFIETWTQHPIKCTNFPYFSYVHTSFKLRGFGWLIWTGACARRTECIFSTESTKI